MKSDFEKFALSRGISSMSLDSYKRSVKDYVSPVVIEERNMNITTLDVYSRLLLDKIIFIGSEIDDYLANTICAQLLWLSQQDSNDVSIYINSGGGSVNSGMAICDTMQLISNDVSTTIMGMAASMAAVISSNGTKGKRYGLPHSRFMIHQPRMTFGHSTLTASDISIEADEINRLKNELYKKLSENSKLSYEQIIEKSDRDKWYTMDEALNDGFIDEIIVNKK